MRKLLKVLFFIGLCSVKVSIADEEIIPYPIELSKVADNCSIKIAGKKMTEYECPYESAPGFISYYNLFGSEIWVFSKMPFGNECMNGEYKIIIKEFKEDFKQYPFIDTCFEKITQKKGPDTLTFTLESLERATGKVLETNIITYESTYGLRYNEEVIPVME